MLKQVVIIITSLIFRRTNWTRFLYVVLQRAYKNDYYVNHHCTIGLNVVSEPCCVALSYTDPEFSGLFPPSILWSQFGIFG
jgi:hypothetical protein